MLADKLGTSWDQCRSMVQYSFTSTETIRLVRTESPGRPPPLSCSSWTMWEPQPRTYVYVGPWPQPLQCAAPGSSAALTTMVSCLQVSQQPGRFSSKFCWTLMVRAVLGSSATDALLLLSFLPLCVRHSITTLFGTTKEDKIQSLYL